MISNNIIKKVSTILLITLLVNLTPVFADEPEIKIEKIIDFLAFGTGSTTGTYFLLGNAFAYTWTQKSKKINVMTHSTNGSFENIELLRNHEINLAIAQSDTVTAALTGKGKFEGQPYKDLRVLMALYPEVIQIVVASETSNIYKIEDLKGHRVNVGPANSGNALTAIELLETMNISSNDYTMINMSYDEVIQAMEKNECDATIIIAGVPTKAIIELKKRIPIRILSIDLQTIIGTTSKLSYLSSFTLSDDIYGVGKSINTFAVMALLISNKDLKNDLAYNLVKMIFENIDYLKIIHERARDISIKNALKGLNKMYLHDGAAKYLEELKQKNN